MSLPRQMLVRIEKAKSPRHSVAHSPSGTPQPQLPGSVLPGSAGQPSRQSSTPSPSLSARADCFRVTMRPLADPRRPSHRWWHRQKWLSDTPHIERQGRDGSARFHQQQVNEAPTASRVAVQAFAARAWSQHIARGDSLRTLRRNPLEGRRCLALSEGTSARETATS